MCQGNTSGPHGLRMTPEPGTPLARYTRTRNPAGPGRARQARSQGETVSDSFHRCRSSADPGPPLPGPADHALQGLSRGPATRTTPGAGDATLKLHARARHELRRSSPLRQAPTGRVTLTENTAPLGNGHGPSTQPNTLAVKTQRPAPSVPE